MIWIQFLFLSNSVPGVVSFSNGDFVVYWIRDTYPSKLYARKFSSSATAITGETIIRQGSYRYKKNIVLEKNYSPQFPRAIAYKDSSILIVWHEDNLDGNSEGIALQKVLPDLTLSTLITVNSANRMGS